MKATCERAIEGKAAWPKVGRSATMLVAKHKPLLLHNHHFAEGLSTTLVKKKVQLRLQQEGSCRSISGDLSTAVGCTASRPASRLQYMKTWKKGTATPFIFVAPSLGIPPSLQAAASPVLDTLCKEAHFASDLGFGWSIQCRAAHATLRPPKLCTRLHRHITAFWQST